jgi:two-component system, sensor histidine kinase and response regulator
LTDEVSTSSDPSATEFPVTESLVEHLDNMPDVPASTLLEILGVMPLGIAWYTSDQQLRVWNTIASEVSHLPAEMQKPGIKMEDFYRYYAERGDYGDGNIDTLVNDRMKAVYDSGQPKRDLTPNVDEVVESISHGLKDGSLVIFLHDLTERRKQEAEIAERQRKLEELNKQKDEMFALIAHDLRSPLTAVIGFADLIEKFTGQDIDPEKLKEYAHNLGLGARGLAYLVDNLLSWARVQMDDHIFEPEALPLSEVALAAVQPLLSVASHKDISINLELTSSVVVADRVMLETIIRNLTNNSIKFVEQGGTITVSSERIENEQVKIMINDNGIGMTSETVSKLMNNAPVKSRPGTSHEVGAGLGLRICNQFIKEHDSQLLIDSTVGEGSAFSFLLNTA